MPERLRKRPRVCEGLHAPIAKWLMNLLLLALVPACFALNPVIGRAHGRGVRAGLAVGHPLGVVGAHRGLLAPGARRGERWRAPAGHLLRVGVLGALGMGFCAYAAFEGARTSPATNIGLIYGCTSAFVAAWEIAAGRQQLTATLAAAASPPASPASC